MSVYCSVWARCPSCGEQIEFQCRGETGDYYTHSVPISIANAVAGQVEICEKCGCCTKLLIRTADAVEMIAQETDAPN